MDNRVMRLHFEERNPIIENGQSTTNTLMNVIPAIMIACGRCGSYGRYQVYIDHKISPVTWVFSGNPTK